MTYHSAGFVPSIYHVRKGQDTADSSSYVGTRVATAVCMMQLSDEFQLELFTPDDLAPDVDNTSTVAGQYQLAL